MAVACFGKLPFHREFLRLGVDGAAAGGIVRWVEEAHAAWGRGERAPATSPLVRFTAALEGRWFAGVARQSSDGLRRHPVALFADLGPPPASERWPVAPLACAPVWDALAALVARSWDGLPAFAAALAAASPAADLAAAERAWEAAVARPGGFAALAGDRADRARHLALNLLAVARAQAAAGSAPEGVAIAAPLPAAPADALVHAGLWVACVDAAAGVRARPALLLTDVPPRLVGCWRPVEGRDLAAVLSTLDMAPIDDLAEPWQPLPPAEGALASAVDGLVASEGEPMRAVPGRLRNLGGT